MSATSLHPVRAWSRFNALVLLGGLLMALLVACCCADEPSGMAAAAPLASTTHDLGPSDEGDGATAVVLAATATATDVDAEDCGDVRIGRSTAAVQHSLPDIAGAPQTATAAAPPAVLEHRATFDAPPALAPVPHLLCVLRT